MNNQGNGEKQLAAHTQNHGKARQVLQNTPPQTRPTRGGKRKHARYRPCSRL
jgi:hypothetical protein